MCDAPQRAPGSPGSRAARAASAPSAAAWYPIAVTRLWLTGSSIVSKVDPDPSLATGWSSGGPAGSSREALAGAVSDNAGWSPPPNAVTSRTPARDRGNDDENGEPAPPDATRRTLGARCPPVGAGRRHQGDRIGTGMGLSSAKRLVRRRRARLYDRRDERSGRPAAAGPDSALDPAGRPAGRRVLRLGVRPGRGSHGLPVPRRRADRAAARPDRADARCVQAAARHRGGARVPDVRSGDHRHPRRGRDGRRQPDEDGGLEVQRLFHRQARTEPGLRGRQPAPALARHPPPAEPQDRAERPPDRVAHPETRRGALHAQDRQLRRGGGDLHRPGALRLRAGPRRLDLHAPRHAAAVASRGPTFSPARGQAADREDGARARLVRPRAGGPLADHRHERRSRDVDPRCDRARARGGLLRPALRGMGGDHGGASLPGPLARRDPGGDLRRRRPPVLGHLGRAPVPRHPPDRGPHRRPEGDGERPAPAPAADHLRPARRHEHRRADRRAARAAAARGRPGRVGVLLRAHRLRVVDAAAVRSRWRSSRRRIPSPSQTVVPG